MSLTSPRWGGSDKVDTTPKRPLRDGSPGGDVDFFVCIWVRNAPSRLCQVCLVVIAVPDASGFSDQRRERPQCSVSGSKQLVFSNFAAIVLAFRRCLGF